jgi:molybdopterin-guanine dinucleotide biosynthesis protein A
MGRDKARLRLGRRTLLGHVRAAAAATGWPVRVIRKDLVPRCGPLGGIYTALKTTKADAVLFLACDMPFVTPALMRAVVRERRSRDRAVFVRHWRGAGFPLLLRRNSLSLVEGQLITRRFDLQALANAVSARRFTVGSRREGQLFNVNDARDWQEAKRRFAQRTPRQLLIESPAAGPVKYAQRPSTE